MLYLLLGCPGIQDTADSAGPSDTSDTGENPVSGDLSLAKLVIHGNASSATGQAVAFGPDTNGDGAAAAWVSGYFTNYVCRFEAQSGSMDLLSGATCLHSSSGDYMGYALAVGETQAAMGAVGGRENGAYSGTVYVADAALLPGVHELSDVAVLLHGESENDYAGSSLAWLAAADGPAVLVVGAPGNDENGAGSGRVYALTAGVDGINNLSDSPTVIRGSSPTSAVRHGAPEAGDGAGSVLSSAGDLDGDGNDELVIGCNGADDGGSNAGIAAVFYGPLGAGVVDLRTADVVIAGETDEQYAGDFATGLGDTDGDGRGDLAISGEMSLSGRTWVFAGPPVSGVVSSATASFFGENQDDLAGASLAGAGDADGDGFADLLIGAYGVNGSHVDAGGSYLVFGPFNAGAQSLQGQLRFDGEADGDASGRNVAGGGDYDGDGLGDLLIGAPYSDAGGAFGGAAYVVTEH